MATGDFINKLVTMFRFWIMTTDCRSINIYEAFLDVTSKCYTLKDICDIINISMYWSDTDVGYDVCSEIQLEWSVISLITFFKLYEAGEFEGLPPKERIDMEYCLTAVFSSSMNKFKQNTKLWHKRKEQKSGHLIMQMLEKYKVSEGNDASLPLEIKKILAAYKYL